MMHAGTYSDFRREINGDDSESEIFYIPVWNCLQARYTRNKNKSIGKGSPYILNSFSVQLLIS